MPFFLIVPAWMFCCVVGIVLLFFKTLRRAGIYVINISTASTVVAFVVSTAVIFLGPRIGLQRIGEWAGVALIAAYVVSIGVGGLIGAIAGIWFTRRLLNHEKVKRADSSQAEAGSE